MKWIDYQIAKELQQLEELEVFEQIDAVNDHQKTLATTISTLKTSPPAGVQYISLSGRILNVAQTIALLTAQWHKLGKKKDKLKEKLSDLQGRNNYES